VTGGGEIFLPFAGTMPRLFQHSQNRSVLVFRVPTPMPLNAGATVLQFDFLNPATSMPLNRTSLEWPFLLAKITIRRRVSKLKT